MDEYNKELTLRVLHILSALGFMKNIICQFVSSDNWWLLRVKYLIVYYSVQSLKILLKQYDKLFSWFRDDLWFINVVFRNCMMHYDINSDNGNDMIGNNIDLRIPMFGIIENCFGGKDYTLLNKALDEEIEYIIENLNKILILDCSNVQNL